MASTGSSLKNFSAQTFETLTFASRLLPFSRIPPFKSGLDANTGHPACQAVFSTFSSMLDGFVVCFYSSKACQNIS
jgi:hypothetical protein